MVLWHPFMIRISAEMTRDVGVCLALKEKGVEVELDKRWAPGDISEILEPATT